MGTDRIQEALEAAGYSGMLPTVDNLRICFTDYADAGVWQNLDPDDVAEIRADEMAAAILKYCRRRRT